MEDTIEVCIFHLFFTAPQREKIQHFHFLGQVDIIELKTSS